MKKLIKTVCSAFCVMSITVPVNALANSQEEATDLLDEQIEQSADESQDNNAYHMAFLTGDFGLQVAKGVAAEPIETLVLFISDPNGKIIKDAQVVNTIVDQDGRQTMSRARPYRGGYLVAIHKLPTGRYRLETEIVADGQLLTDEFIFNRA